jgi:hypothetical protein
MTAASRIDTVADELVTMGVPEARVQRWRVPRAAYRPTVTVERDAAGSLQAAALTSARPATAATKIVDLWWGDEDAARRVLAELISAARDRGDVALKWEVPAGAGLPGFAAHAGFVAMRRPWAAVGTESARGFVLWLQPGPAREFGYFAQTTLFTCGAVAALIASEDATAGGFDGGPDDRDLELGFWRGASNYPACEPVGLAVALRDRLGEAPVEVHLDLDGPALLEGYTGFEHDFRALLQQESHRQAAERGIPVGRDRVQIAEVLRRVAAGERALLLIDEAPMHGEAGPHWVIAHAVVGGAAVIEDPWVNVATGETWVDTHALPVAADDLDRLVRWGDEGYRGVIFVGGA